jgi:hypothetical protein
MTCPYFIAHPTIEVHTHHKDDGTLTKCYNPRLSTSKSIPEPPANMMEWSRRSCAIGCRFFGQDVLHFVCEPETTEDILRKQRTCRLPPDGWWCSRAAGHEGPCAARAFDDPMSDIDSGNWLDGLLDRASGFLLSLKSKR